MIGCKMNKLGWAAVMAAVLVASFPAQADECRGADSETLLKGTWRSGTDQHVMIISREGDKLSWTYERGPGVQTDRWGEKAAATGAGIVEKIDGCRAFLAGYYTRYEGRDARSRPAVGWPMTWKFMITEPDQAASEGLGYGREAFYMRWHKAP